MPKSRHEPLWPAILNTLAIAGLFYSLPKSVSPGPSWLFPLLTVLLLIAASIAHRVNQLGWNFAIGVALLTVVTIADGWSLSLLLSSLPLKPQHPSTLLRSAVSLWVSNILIFASWYWRLDAGGTHRRFLRDTHTEGAFLFPQLSLPPDSPIADPRWRPGFVDYFFLAFNTSTAFSPTDTPVLSPWAKLLMICQAAISLGIIAFVVARGISLF